MDIQPFRVAVPERSWIEARYSLVHFTSQPRGGHFAAWEQPELFAADVAAFFRTLR